MSPISLHVGGKKIVKQGYNTHAIWFKTLDTLNTSHTLGGTFSTQDFIAAVRQIQDWRRDFIKIQSALRAFKNDYIDAII